ncbi:MAG: hypothetical protein H0U64_05615 [Gemmatimonadaceae bacterium]|nr:hypothetical protein [Gemmatimonadaceae bacterium]
MKRQIGSLLVASSVFLIATGCREDASLQSSESSQGASLEGAWRSQVHFRGGILAGMTDLEFLYAYNAGGTMTESSNYDEAANSSPPAYGVWKKTGPGRFETKYVFFQTRAPGPVDGIASAGGWLPAGHGVLTETITLSSDGTSYTSTIKYASFDKNGKPMEGGGDGFGAGTRIGF